MEWVILLAVLVLVGNVLDSVTTRLCLGLPKDRAGHEGNPLMASLMDGDYLIAELVKHLGVALFVGYWVYFQDIESLLIVSLVWGMVVLSNGYIYLTRKITKRKVSTAFSGLSKVCRRYRIPSWVEFIVVIGVMYGVAKWLSNIILGGS